MTQELLKKHLHYDPTTGVFTRIWHPSKHHQHYVGREAGAIKHGYVYIRVEGGVYGAHRLAWLYMHGVFPEIIDHIDGNPTNNSIYNLRNTTTRGNAQNRVEHREGNLVGAHWNKMYKSWRSQIGVDGVSYHLGSFSTQLEAHQAYIEAKNKTTGKEKV